MNGHDSKKMAGRGYGRQASSLRQRTKGVANQMAHETAGRMQRKSALARLAAQKADGVKRGAQRARKDGIGMNAGTIGGARRTR